MLTNNSNNSNNEPLIRRIGKPISSFGLRNSVPTEDIGPIIKLHDGTLLFGAGGSIKQWCIDRKYCVQEFIGHNNIVVCLVQVNNDSFVSGSRDTTLKQWDLKNGLCLSSFLGHIDWVLCATKLQTTTTNISAALLASGSCDGTIRIWRMENQQCVRIINVNAVGVVRICTLQDGTIASLSRDKTVNIWNPSSGERVRILKGHTSIIDSMIELSNGILVTYSYDKVFKMWNKDNGTWTCIHTIDLISYPHINTMLKLKNGTFVTGSVAGSLTGWNQKGQEIFTCCSSAGIEVILELDNGCIATSTFYNVIEVWQVKMTASK